MSRNSKKSRLPKTRHLRQQRKTALAVCGFLLLAIGIVFGQTLRHEFVNYDDGVYVYQNPHVMRGLTPQGIAWAATTTHESLWAPLTWTSYLLDSQLYGLKPWGYHLTNVLLHATTTIILFLVLWRMTGDLWPSAFVAAVFAVHPLHVESVAWVAERKGLLSGLFFMLTLGAYVGYVRHRFSIVRYLTVMVLFALGLMAKPMLVTLPFVLLLLDYWPLGRVAGTLRVPPARWGGSCTATPGATVQLSPQRVSVQPQTAHGVCLLLVEKIPLLLLTVVSCAATPLTQGIALQTLEFVSLPLRVANALVSYVVYLGQFFYPAGLAVLYPHPGASLPIWKAAVALPALLGISAAALACWRKRPYLLVGWLWYLGMLVPVLGLVQVGIHAMADRYTYLPQIGLCIALAWLIKSFCCRHPHHCNDGALCVASALVVAALMGWAWRQTTFWRDSETLWPHTLACTSQNYMAHYNLGNDLTIRERFDEAIRHYRQAVEIKPDFTAAGNNLGNILARRGRGEEAIAKYRRVLEIKPDFAETRYNLGRALSERGQFDEAIVQYQKVLEIKPDYAVARHNLGVALSRRKQILNALAEQRELLRLNPNNVALLNDTAWALATDPNASLRNGPQAVELAQRAVKLSDGQQPAILGTLAAAYAEVGRFAEAVEAARKALELAKQQNQHALAESIQAKIPLYQAGNPFRQPSSARLATPPQP